MKKIFLGFLAAFGVVIILIGMRGYATQGSTVIIGNTSVTVEVARTEQERARGLMYRDLLAENTGMLFVFEKTESQTFWNNNTFVPLDVIWIRDGSVVGISQLPDVREAGIVTVASPESVDHVLEVRQGFAKENNITAGSDVHY